MIRPDIIALQIMCHLDAIVTVWVCAAATTSENFGGALSGWSIDQHWLELARAGVAAVEKRHSRLLLMIYMFCSILHGLNDFVSESLVFLAFYFQLLII